MAWYRLSVSSPYLRTEQTRDIEVPNECSERDKENFIQSELEAFVWEYVRTDWEEIDESEKKKNKSKKMRKFSSFFNFPCEIVHNLFMLFYNLFLFWKSKFFVI